MRSFLPKAGQKRAIMTLC